MPQILKLSIITINLNNAKGLLQTIESVINQTYTNFEHIIIDGNSSDGSVDIIKNYEDKYTNIEGGISWISENDKGIYNAMNKGIKVAKGEYCLFLNSGDWLLENTGLFKIFKSHNEDIIYCNIKTPYTILKYPSRITLYDLFTSSLPHPASFIRTSLFSAVDLYNENFQIVSDWEFYLKAFINRDITYKHIDYVLTFYEENGISSGEISKEKQRIERNEAIQTLPVFIRESAEELIYYRDAYNGLLSSKIIRISLKIIKLKKTISKFLPN